MIIFRKIKKYLKTEEIESKSLQFEVDTAQQTRQQRAVCEDERQQVTQEWFVQILKHLAVASPKTAAWGPRPRPLSRQRWQSGQRHRNLCEQAGKQEVRGWEELWGCRLGRAVGQRALKTRGNPEAPTGHE